MFELDFPVLGSCLASDGLHSPVSILHMMQNCIGPWQRTEPEFASWLEEHNLKTIITSRQLDIRRRATFGETLTAQTSVWDIKGPLLHRDTQLLDQQGQVVATSWNCGPIINLQTGKMERVPKDLLGRMALERLCDMERLGKRIRRLTSDDAQIIVLPGEAYRVKPSDIDVYQHMNNVAYVRLAADQLPLDFAWDRMRVEYRNQARLGMTIHPQISIRDTVAQIDLQDSQGETFAFVEFSTVQE